MPLKVQLDHDVAKKLQAKAEALGTTFDVAANRVLRTLLTVARQGRSKVKTREASNGSSWYELDVRDGVDENKPGIYEWIIEGRGSYIGKYKSIKRPTQQYERNVRNLISGKNYRLGKPDKFRRIHRELCDAHIEGRTIKLIILENCELPDINQRERQLIKDRGKLNGNASHIHSDKHNERDEA